MSQKSGEEHHTLRSADSSVLPLTQPEKQYWGRIANRTTQILRAKIKAGKLKPQRSGKHRGHINKIGVLIIILTVSMVSAGVYAQYRGQITAQTSIRAPIYVTSTQFQLPDIWVNHTGSFIQDGAFVINSGGQPVTYTFLIYAETKINGTQTQDMSKLFYQFSVILNDYSKNVTTVSLLNTPQPVSFQYPGNTDQNFRVIIQYVSKPVQLGTTVSPLTISFAYSYSGQ